MCPTCREPIEEMREMLCFNQNFIVTDFSNFTVKHRRSYKRLNHIEEVLHQSRAKWLKCKKKVSAKIRERSP